MNKNHMGRATVVVGGQYGSEGKGAITSHISRSRHFGAAVRGGSSNAGHTIEYNGKRYKNQCIPVSWTEEKTKLYISAGAIVDIPQIKKELGWMADEGFDPHNLLIDPYAGVITEEHIQQERDNQLGQSIGSTVHGCGAALAAKVWRRGFKVAHEYPELLPFVAPRRVSTMLHNHLTVGDDVLLEGTQGTLLSLNHAPHYPYCTSRDATTSGIITEAGLPPSVLDDVVMVVRALPIRVGGNSGPTGAAEMTWEEVARQSGLPELVPERTTVTNKVRRIFQFSWHDFAYACRLNGPTAIALTFADYIDGSVRGAHTWDELSLPVKQFVNSLEAMADVPVRYIKTGQRDQDMVDLSGVNRRDAEVSVSA